MKWGGYTREDVFVGGLWIIGILAVIGFGIARLLCS